MAIRSVHYIGFRDDRYLNAWRVFGGPAFIHRRYDTRALRDIGEDDLVIFANGPAHQTPSARNGDDLIEDDPAVSERRQRAKVA